VEGDLAPPMMCPMFKDEEAARKIFKGLQNEFGKHDSDDKIEIGIITGIDKEAPHNYNVVIQGSWRQFIVGKEDVEKIIAIARFNTMAPSSSVNLDRFLESYNKFKMYYFAPAIWKDVGDPEFLSEYAIRKKELKIVPAWKIGPNHSLTVGIGDNPNPIIPKGEKNPPFREVKKRKSRSRK